MLERWKEILKKGIYFFPLKFICSLYHYNTIFVPGFLFMILKINVLFCFGN